MLKTTPVNGQLPVSQPRPLPIYGTQFWERPRHPVTGQQRAQTPTSVRTMWSYHWMDASLYLGFALCCHSNATCAPIANPPNTAQLGGSPHRSPKLHPGPCNSGHMAADRQTNTQTYRQTHRHAWPQYILLHLRLMQNVIINANQATGVLFAKDTFPNLNTSACALCFSDCAPFGSN